MFRNKFVAFEERSEFTNHLSVVFYLCLSENKEEIKWLFRPTKLAIEEGVL